MAKGTIMRQSNRADALPIVSAQWRNAVKTESTGTTENAIMATQQAAKDTASVQWRNAERMGNINIMESATMVILQ